MKLPKGVTVGIGNKQFKSEVPDKLLNQELKASLEKKYGKSEAKKKPEKDKK